MALNAANRVALGENSRMLIGGPSGVDLSAQILAGLVAPFASISILRFVTGTVDVGGAEIDATDNLSFGFSEATRGPKLSTMVADAFWRTADNPFSGPPVLIELEETPRVMIWPDFLNSVANYIKYPIGFCQGFTITNSGTAEIRYNLRLRSQKTYYTMSRPDPLGTWY